LPTGSVIRFDASNVERVAGVSGQFAAGCIYLSRHGEVRQRDFAVG
jgi:hypothetical protein